MLHYPCPYVAATYHEHEAAWRFYCWLQVTFKTIVFKFVVNIPTTGLNTYLTRALDLGSLNG